MRAIAIAFTILLSACEATDDPICEAVQTVSCQGGTAHGTTTFYANTAANAPCADGDRDVVATCASGCALEASLSMPASADYRLLASPSLLCEETPVAKIGDACDDTRPCLPTRATLAADGTVAADNDLECGEAGTCVAAVAPVVRGYLTACTAATIAQYGGANTTGVVADPATGSSACLIAWDAAAQTSASGLTTVCIGDWNCPDGALCDDQLTLLSTSSLPVAVCKPGPKGTLTPAMLAH